MPLRGKYRPAGRRSLVLLLCLLLAACGLTPPRHTAPPEGSSFAIHFIDVGQGDSALVLCDGAAMLIDGGESDQSSLLYSYLRDLDIRYLDYLVATHPHSDHIGGLSGAVQIARVGTALSPVDNWDAKTFRSLKKYLAEQGVTFTVPAAGDAFELGSAAVTVLGPLKDYDEVNDTSIVLRIDYGETSFLFTGDMERTAEADLLDAGADLSATVLKAGHHGSGTSTSYPFLRAVNPAYAVISCGAGNSYGHPDQDTLSRLRDAGATVYRTDLQGTVICESDGEAVTFTTERDTAPTPPRSDREEPPEDAQAPDPSQGPDQEPDQAQEAMIGNKKSKKFHAPDCPNLPAESNRVLFDSYEAAQAAGYAPCGNCLGKTP